MSLTRRIAIGVLLTGAGLLFSSGYSVMDALAKPARKPSTGSKKPGELKVGQFDWHPERSPSGPLAIIVSLTKQRVYVYRNGIQIGVATCSTGTEGHETPTGVFTILEKEEEHYSNTYDNAPMPHMHRLTWDGIALMPAGYRVILRRMAAFACPRPSPKSSTASPRLARR